MKIMMSAGEASGDIYGAYLAEELIRLNPDIRVFGIGGPEMRKRGVSILEDPTSFSAVGFTEILSSLSFHRKTLNRALQELIKASPDCLVLIDFPEFNMRLMRQAVKHNIPRIYLFPPTAWAWRRGRAETLANSGAIIASVFPLEADTYLRAGADVRFVGHPLLDLVDPSNPEIKESLRKDMGLDFKEVIGILPGSRDQEVRRILPTMLKAAALIKEKRPGVGFVLPLSHTVSWGTVEENIIKSGLPVRIVSGDSHLCMAVSDVLTVASGTATMEATIVGTPMVVVYKTSRLTYLLARSFINIPFVSWPNNLAERRIVPELLQRKAKPRAIAGEVFTMLNNPALLLKIQNDLAEARNKLGSPGAIMKIAKLILEVARK